MRKRRYNAIFAAAITTTLLTTPSQAKEVTLRCKTDKGRDVSYLINTDPPSVKGIENGEEYKVMLFAPTKIIFKHISTLQLADVIMKTEWIYTIDRNTLAYTAAHNVETNSQSFRESFPSGTASGKCGIMPKKRVLF